MQIVAWTQMFHGNLRQGGGIVQAVEKTFAEEGKCELCLSIDALRDAEESNWLALLAGFDKPFVVVPSAFPIAVDPAKGKNDRFMRVVQDPISAHPDLDTPPPRRFA